MPAFEQLFYIDALSFIMMALVGFVALCVASFSMRYLNGDRKKTSFFVILAGLVASVFVMVSADHMLLFLVFWMMSNILLARLMLHKREWEAARQSARLAFKNFVVGSVFLATAFGLLYAQTGQASIQAMLTAPLDTVWAISIGGLIVLVAMSQSALWPFHRWLTSSLNSPTPVSAVMHAGLVNGGGFLLARFAPMLAEQPVILGVMFVAGLVTALLGTLWKLMQSDIKRMLACSTMGQMGFMVAQCGLGLFPAAVAHLCWHGLFKAYLFLASGAAAQEKRLDLDYPSSVSQFTIALVCGALGAVVFAQTSGKDIFAGDTTLFLIVLAMIAGTQFALPIVRGQGRAKVLLAVIATVVMGALYGGSVMLVEHILAPVAILMPQPLSVVHVIGLCVLVSAWLFILFAKGKGKRTSPAWMLKAYVGMLNASQPHPKTVTAHRNQYQY